ncbi:unnamed protein product, partial [marine sediment metagenome]
PIEITIKDPALAKAMLNLGAEKSNIVVQTAAAFNRFLSLVNTAYVPGFILSNWARDIQTMAINVTADESFKMAKEIAKNNPKAIKAIYQAERGGKETEWTKHYEEFKEAGGKIGFFGLKDVDQIQRGLTKEISLMKPGAKTQTVKVFKAVGKYVMTLNEAVENGTRLSTYVAMRNAGQSKAKAASASKNVTVNFNKKGELGAYFNALYLFANAQVQGTARMLKTLKTPTGKKIAGSILVGSLSLAQMMRM